MFYQGCNHDCHWFFQHVSIELFPRATFTHNGHSIGGRCQTMFVTISVHDRLLKCIISQIIRFGSQAPIASLHKLACRKTPVKLIKIMWKIRASSHIS